MGADSPRPSTSPTCSLNFPFLKPEQQTHTTTRNNHTPLPPPKWLARGVGGSPAWLGREGKGWEGRGGKKLSPLQSVLLTAAGWLPACLTPPASPSCMPQAWQAPGGCRAGLSRRDRKSSKPWFTSCSVHGGHGAHRPGCEQGMVPTSDGS